MILITHERLELEALTAQARGPSNGAVVTFLGTTRDRTEGRRVLYLEYEAYGPMVDNKLQEILGEIRERWGITDAVVAHRIGRLEVGEVSLVVAVAAPHRKEAFAACTYIVDRIKETVPIWKKEVFEDGHVWVGSEEAGVTTSDSGPDAGSG
ncbi:MAG: molybdenum cofactor biosynthesis protein MoaE [Chloroflexi bacterium]|nr:molybdenum cofactor biosynthesis protein MoaE [Chloroflexota bacterium]